MSLLNDLRKDVNSIIAHGEQVRIKYYHIINNGSGYDDDKRFVQSGNDIWTSGLKQPMNSAKGSDDMQMMEEGHILFNDSRLYLPGTINTSGLLKIGMGSPVTKEYSVLPAGTDASVEIAGDAVYKKVFIRFLKNGSLDNE